MKPVNVDGRPIFQHIYRKIVAIGERLVEMDWKESYNKPNLFYKKFGEVMVFADMRGTEIIPIWEAPHPLIYAGRGEADWKRRYAINQTTDELYSREIEYRFSFPDLHEPDGLFFGPEEELPDGSCKMCNKEIKDPEREGGLFCTDHCEKAFAQLMELRREESEHDVKCALCGKPLGKWDNDTILHHITYEPEEKTIHVCRSCHMKIHSNFEKYPDLAPKRPPNWRRLSSENIDDVDGEESDFEMKPPYTTHERAIGDDLMKTKRTRERPDISLRDLLGTRTERLIEAIAVDDFHTWSELKEATEFSEKELNFHLRKLYSKQMLTRRGSPYYLVTGVVEAYSNIDWRREELNKRAKKKSNKKPRYSYILPSLNPKEAGAKKKKMRGE